ncbi:hypothetical protein AVEN_201263-1 [Araneus ventricosus]|uniref:Uncharacterized protein n=1 Tax=Araneus ventricosus TaxID=182803 RepID=A0A4Y2SNF0_ARAVE|nr:hypothetical protein AVEN_176747-1 [Araneus ventricosus]GBN72044.1 hypothetical protein AVEN_77130-1 [Araneus ventricosus]GBN89826.1 hypothetical protein AVEN_228057-1 [Araneus ventricosus]GBN89834.1 hypothetical protein AVEN_201263-1 [Araneus ventricosus]
MGPCDDLPAKPELLHWGTMKRALRDLVTRLRRASVNSAIKEHGVMCRLTATAFDENDPSVRTMSVRCQRRELYVWVCQDKSGMNMLLCHISLSETEATKGLTSCDRSSKRAQQTVIKFLSAEDTNG